MLNLESVEFSWPPLCNITATGWSSNFKSDAMNAAFLIPRSTRAIDRRPSEPLVNEFVN
jgi:hypothetical protein